MRIGVLDTNQNPTESPSRHISKARASKFVRRRIAKWLIVNRLLQMVREAEEIRGDAKYTLPELRITHKRKSWKQNILLYYPHKSQESTIYR